MEEQDQDQPYIDGFNNGYLLAKHEPSLANQLTATDNAHSMYFNGLVSGKAEYEREVREWAKNFTKGAPARDDREQDRNR